MQREVSGLQEQTAKPAVSVIMGVYNQWNETALREAVGSILNQTFADFEFIIWDDGSHPCVAKTIQSLSALDGRIQIAGRDENHGLAYSLNACIGMARGTYIARMDADDISLPQRLKRQFDFLESHTEYAWCGCNTGLFDQNGVWGVRKMPEKPVLRDYLKYSPYVHPTVMFRAKLFDANEGYLESGETLRCEDYEIFMRFMECGLQGYNLQEVLFCYREDQDSYQRRKFCFRLNEAKLRYRNFRKMGILFPAGWIYALRPIAGGLLPSGILARLKRNEGIRVKREESKGDSRLLQQTTEIYAVPQYTLSDVSAQNGFARMP